MNLEEKAKEYYSINNEFTDNIIFHLSDFAQQINKELIEENERQYERYEAQIEELND